MDKKFDKLLGSLRESDAEAGIEALAAINAANSAIILELDFLVLTPYVFNCPCNMKFTSQVSEGTDATLSVAHDTNMAQFDKLTITPTQIGLIILNGIKL